MICSSSLGRSRTAFTFYILCILLTIYIILRSAYDDLPMQLPSHLQKYFIYENVADYQANIDVNKLKRKLDEINYKRNITNLDKYMPMDADTTVLLVQVHKDIGRLRHLVASLAQVRDIQTTLLIFSHSFYDERINRLIADINFCKVMQIYYPHSLQLNPHKFPGVDLDDCSPGVKNTGHCAVRDAALAEHKQHWWWKANFVFQRMHWSRTHRAPVIFLEENNYAAPDLLHMSQYMLRSFRYFPYVEVMSFGRPLSKHLDTDLLVLEPWRPPFDVGLAFNRTTWNKILSFSAQYCMHDDRSWSYSLFNLFQNFPGGHASMIACMTPRVLSTREFADSQDISKKFISLFRKVDSFPENVKTVYLFGRDGKVDRVFQTPPVGSGGWNDLRDQVLCLDPLLGTTTEELRYYEHPLRK